MSMSSAATLPVAPLRDFSDRLSPMVVKEMRQGLRGKVFVSMLVVFQLIMTLVVAMAAGGESESDVRTFFWLALMLVMLVGLPMRGFGLLAAEQKEATLDMLMLTSISSMRIVFGKWLALFTQSLLLVVSLLPYMLARYHFGGVEVVNELVALYFVLLLSALLVLVFTTQAAPLLWRIGSAPADPVLVAGLLDRFTAWTVARVVCVDISIAAVLVALAFLAWPRGRAT